MSRDPEKLTDADMTKVVAELRAQRARWDQAEAEGKTRAPKAPKAGAKAPKPKIDLTDMEL